MIKFEVLGPKAVKVEGGGYVGVFADAHRAHKWIEERMSGKPYNPIPKAGEM